MVTLVVGWMGVLFTVHRDLICEASSFFEAAFMGSTSFKESSEQSISLPEDDTEMVGIFARWLYGYVFACLSLQVPRCCLDHKVGPSSFAGNVDSALHQ